ncbi:MAG: hypothetical protein LBU94_01350 [Clostridiales bacterium]|jgi:hypothetical protein|nr:hypothetical protein [Clostridiales bacterium]
MEIIELKKYLSDVLGREQALFALNKIKNNINQKVIEAEKQVIDIKMPIRPSAAANIRKREKGFVEVVVVPLMVVLSIIFTLVGLFVQIFFYSAIIIIFFAIVIKKYVTHKSENLIVMEIIMERKRIEKKFEIERRAAEDNKKTAEAERGIIIASLNNELYEVERHMQETKAALDMLYSLDIIFGKYRHFVAIASICEYFQSGRCSTLEGHEGAYNIYENELRQDVVIGQLSAVMDNLQKVQDTQYMLYTAISDANRISQSISDNISNISNGINSLADTSAANAYFTQEAAYNTKLLVDINRGDYGLLKDKRGYYVNENR